MAIADSGNGALVDALDRGDREGAFRTLKSERYHQNAAKILIQRGQKEHMTFMLRKLDLDVDKHFLLHHALIAHQEGIAKLLIESGADVNNCKTGPRCTKRCADYSCDLPLQWSLYCSLVMTRFLLESYADVNKRNHAEKTPLMYACGRPVSADRVAFLLENGADVHAQDRNEATPLHRAARLGYTEKVTLLIQHGADIEAENSSGFTPLLWVCSKSEGVDCLKILLENGADCRAMNFKGETGLHLAAKSGNSMALKLLIQYGAQLEARTRNGDTALILACGESVPAECVRILLENGAFPNVKNRDKKTPLSIAKETRNEEKIQMLLRCGTTEEDKTDQETDLMLACGESGNARSVLNLLQNNALSNVKNRSGETALHIAVYTGDIETLKVLVQYKADVNARTNFDETPLMLACANSSVNVKCVRFLLDNKALPNVTDLQGNTALCMAVSEGDIEKVNILLGYGADVNASDGETETPLMLACADDSVNVKCVQLLLENRALSSLRDIKGDTALHRVIHSGRIEKVRLLVQYGADVNAINRQVETPLILACEDSSVHTEIARCLLENKALPNATDNEGYTALHRAVRSGGVEKVGKLVQYRADVNAVNVRNETPLMLACNDDNCFRTECMKILLKHKALPNKTDVTGHTALHRAIRSADAEKVRILVQYGADVNVETKDKERPLILACDLYNTNPRLHRGLKIIKLLVEHGADLEARKRWGETPFLTAVRKGNRQLIELLHRLGANVCAEGRNGQNAIMAAMSNGIELLQSLIDKGVSIHHRDKNGWTPLMLAAKCKYMDIYKYLITIEADIHAVGTWKTNYGIQNCTALSILIEQTDGIDKQTCRKLITRGAANGLPERCNYFLHLMIAKNQRMMLKELLPNGMAPTMSDRGRLRSFGPVGPVSPLTVALDRGNIPVIQYLLGNLMLCPCDIYGHSYFNQWRPKLISENETEVVTLMDEFYSQPNCLFQLSFVTVSHALGGVPGRVDRVNSLPLPSIVKDKLLFKNIDVPMILK